MAGAQENDINLSLIVSEVLSDVGLNEELVMRRRNGTLLMESLMQVDTVMTKDGIIVHLFGSQSEGTTTRGLNSDDDELNSYDTHHVIQEWPDWKCYVTNLLMVQDETTSPGYCHLQLLRDNVPLAASYLPDNEYCADSKGRICLKNTKFHNAYNHIGNHEQHGPAANSPGGENEREMDIVPAFRCERWPREARPWLQRISASGWPSLELKAKSERSGCFLVPVGSKINDLNQLEWRISTSHAERYLMFSLNITHLRCYVLMKMLLKSHINRGCDNVISSYMCKTAMFHCVERTNDDLWLGHNLILCLNQIMRELYDYVFNINCPHFIIPENNLMAERITQQQQEQLLENIQYVINSNGRVLFEINTDDIGVRLQMKLNLIREPRADLPSAVFIHRRVSGHIMFHVAQTIIGIMCNINNDDNIQEVIQQLLCYYARCKQHYSHSSELQQEAYRLRLPLLCSTIGSVLANYDIMQNKPFSGTALEWFKLGLNSDVSSGCLKLATVYYSTGKMYNMVALLRYVEGRYDRNVVQPVCSCHVARPSYSVPGFEAVVDRIQNDAISRWVSYCVMFTRCEGNLVPHEMQQEYNRSTQDEIQRRPIYDNVWMNFSVVDSLPYLYFLQYKTYGRLGRRREQETALQKLERVTRDERNLPHKETALNLLGQCREQENQPDEAFNCYERSLLVRPDNNAAQFHCDRMCQRNQECDTIDEELDIDDTSLKDGCCRKNGCCVIM